jgi:hypothetical protein
MVSHGIVLYHQSKYMEMPMKLTDKISWLMGRVQKSLFPHLDDCLDTPSQSKKGVKSLLDSCFALK